MSLQSQQQQLLARSNQDFLDQSHSTTISEIPQAKMTLNSWLSSSSSSSPNSSAATTADTEASSNNGLMAPVLTPRSLSYWLETNDNQQQSIDTINDRVPPVTDISQWLASTSSSHPDLIQKMNKLNMIGNAMTSYSVAAHEHAKRRADLDKLNWTELSNDASETVHESADDKTEGFKETTFGNVSALAQAYMERKAELELLAWTTGDESPKSGSQWLLDASLNASTCSSVMSSSTDSFESAQWLAQDEAMDANEDKWLAKKEESLSKNLWILQGDVVQNVQWLASNGGGMNKNLWIVQDDNNDVIADKWLAKSNKNLWIIQDDIDVSVSDDHKWLANSQESLNDIQDEDNDDDFTDVSSIAIIEEEEDDDDFDMIDEVSKWLVC